MLFVPNNAFGKQQNLRLVNNAFAKTYRYIKAFNERTACDSLG